MNWCCSWPGGRKPPTCTPKARRKRSQWSGRQSSGSDAPARPHDSARPRAWRSARSSALAIFAPEERGISSTTTSRSGSSSLPTPPASRCCTAPRGRARDRGELHVRADPFTEARVGHRHRGDELDGRMGRDLRLDLGRTDVLAARMITSGDPADHREVAIGVEAAAVAHAHPAVGREQRVVAGGVVEVAGTGRGTAAGGLAVSGIGDVAVAVEQPDEHVGHDAARGREPAFGRIVDGRAAQEAGLVRSVELQDPAAGALLDASARAYGTASPPVNITRSEERSKRSRASESHIMTNCVLTQPSTSRGAVGSVRPRVGREAGGNDARRTQPDRRRVRGPDAEAERRGDGREEHVVAPQVAVTAAT